MSKLKTLNGREKTKRRGITVFKLRELVPDSATAELLFEEIFWGETGRFCHHCGATDTVPKKNGKPAKYRCRTCRKHFNVKTATMMQGTQLGLHIWIYAIYLLVTNRKGIAVNKIKEEFDVTLRTAWYLMHRLRQAMFTEYSGKYIFDGEVEVDESFFGGKEKNKHASKKLRAGRGSVGKTPVIGIKDRETGLIRTRVIKRTDIPTCHGFIKQNVKVNSFVYTDEARQYMSLKGYKHISVSHSAGEYVKGKASTNGIESHWAMMKRGWYGIYHNWSVKHLDRYVAEFEGRHNVRRFDTLDQMAIIIKNMGGTHLPYKELVKEEKSNK